MAIISSKAVIRVSSAMGGFVATLRGQRATGVTRREAALTVARQVYGPGVNVSQGYLNDNDAAAGIQCRYYITRRINRGAA